MDLLRMVLDARRISPTTATNALTIKDSPERIAAASRVITAIDKARPEVIIDVELIEVDRAKLQEYGLPARCRVRNSLACVISMWLESCCPNGDGALSFSSVAEHVLIAFSPCAYPCRSFRLRHRRVWR